MNKRVVCINDKQLPTGAEIKEGAEYNVRKTFINYFDQRAYMLEGIRNIGRTKYGLPWEGYNTQRFDDIEVIEEKREKVSYALD